MRRVHGVRPARLAGVTALLGAIVACGSSEAGAGDASPGPDTAQASPTARPSPSHARFVEEIEWADGRRVGMYYAAKRGLMEQHQDTAGGAWSKPRLVHATTSDPCQGITLKAFEGGTVAAIADWGPYCSDGEPPMESIAAVGTKNLSKWDTKLKESFDGWAKVEASDGVERLTFTRSSTEWLTRLRWSRTDGFGEVEDIRR
ncbi:hypothetical protein O3Q52_32650 [Streptomyces sp. ActVer]|uniref:hypothetical protein n=1 Tax=Streptomyces sp. ActVer TaxID=3014558 RepID=UPI0022B31AB7|nr:hypothetical protein [Streptomyces sp. ActVer]MCZ4512829.1 hypothetical protein [Streptomyces sp. ActVer]